MDNAAEPDERFPSDEDLASFKTINSHRLPQLAFEAQTFPDSCLSLSIPLLNAIRARLPPAPAVTLSIGSGTGLVEALMQSLPRQPCPLNLVSVEVAPSPNKYHAPHRTVPGTWALEPLAEEAAAWLFVYPKQVALVRAYMATTLSGVNAGGPDTVVYVGPRMDWDEFRGAFEGLGEIELWSGERMEEVGGRAWECVAVLRRSAK